MKKIYTILIFLFSFYFSSAQKPVAKMAYQGDTSNCEYVCLGFSDSSTNNPTSWLWTFTGASPSSSTMQNPVFVCWNNVGSYSVKLIVYNSSGSDSVTLNNLVTVIQEPPQPTVTRSNDTLFCSTDTSYVSYQWYYNSDSIPGAIDTFLVINQSGSYNVVVTNKEGCSVGLGCTLCAVHELFDTPFTIFPNPAFEQLIVHSTNYVDRVRISILNLMGQNALSPVNIERAGENIVIDISTLSPGFYFVEMQNEKGKWTERFVKE